MASKYHATRGISAYNAELDRKVRLGLLDEEQGNKMKEEFSHKMESFIQRWSEAGDKWLKERRAELCSKKIEPEEDFEVSEKPREVEPIKKKKKSRKKVKG
ncbi:MAG: hypothetical protein J5U19_11420 [Candidatus Methanoperedens sp.]|nr:hypothetical protein [Candidatus Methanoperedens sp.]MCE8428986.1 hypothetical protein [Candidatus Methanoperedens sp.]